MNTQPEVQSLSRLEKYFQAITGLTPMEIQTIQSTDCNCGSKQVSEEIARAQCAWCGLTSAEKEAARGGPLFLHAIGFSSDLVAVR